MYIMLNEVYKSPLQQRSRSYNRNGEHWQLELNRCQRYPNEHNLSYAEILTPIIWVADRDGWTIMAER